jgi:AraC family transcriptional regulator, transcriptional activator of pobA
MGQSSGLGRHSAGSAQAGVAIRRLPPGSAPLRVLRLPPEAGDQLPGPHTHDHLALAYFERDGGSVEIGDYEWPLRAGDALLVAPGERYDARGLAKAAGWVVFFEASALPGRSDGTTSLWEAHPVLSPFAAGGSDRPRRFVVPSDQRGIWTDTLMGLERELHERLDGFELAGSARLTILLVALARLASDIPQSFQWNREPLLADVFKFIDDHFRERISLRDVAEAVNLSPGHVTTVVRRRTGQPVQAWITERRMAEARRLLRTEDHPVEEIGRRVGYEDAGYFARSFRRTHQTSPAAWRRLSTSSFGRSSPE